MSGRYVLIKPVYKVPAPFGLWLFGEEGTPRVNLYFHARDGEGSAKGLSMEEKDIARARKLFPEAEVSISQTAKNSPPWPSPRH